jgi:predicted  nucleic acid-binding Zn-ribbon protein
MSDDGQRLEGALQRLERLVGRVSESALGEPTRRQLQEAKAQAEHELAALQAERERMAAELVGLKAENAELRRLTEMVTSRLDQAIAELNQLVES